MNFHAKIRVAIFITIIASTIFACKLFQRESQRTTQQGFYAVQPETILNTLAHGENNVFLPIEEYDVNIIRFAPPTGSSVNWTQSDYFYILDAFYKLMLRDTLDDWQLRSISFFLSCAEIDIGLQDGRFEFYKVVMNENNQEVLISRFIDIDPRYQVVLFWEREFYPYVITRKSVDLINMKFDSTKVLQIAEDNGGRNLRLDLNNECNISLYLAPDSVRYRGWNVVYRGDGVAFELNVDPFTGDIDFP